MNIVDRYLLYQFLKIFSICFISFGGLYVVIHMSTNLDEIVSISETPGGPQTLIFDFYGPRLLDFFSRMAGILILVSAVFSIAMMQRRREMTATEAAGITKFRVTRSIVFASIAIIAFSAFCREFYIPQYKTMLVRSLTNWTDMGTVPMHQVKDLQSGILVKGSQFKLNERQITGIQLTLPRRIQTQFLDIRSDIGTVKSADDQQQLPAGILLSDNVQPDDIFQTPSVIDADGQIIIYTPTDHDWLNPDEIFVVCDLDVEEIAFGENLGRYSSLYEMIESLRRPSNRFGLGDQVAIHSRILQPLLELTLLLLGMPIVIANPNRSIFLGAAFCFGVVASVQVVTIASHALGSFGMIQPAALAAWLPVFAFLPFTAVSIKKLFD